MGIYPNFARDAKKHPKNHLSPSMEMIHLSPKIWIHSLSKQMILSWTMKSDLRTRFESDWLVYENWLREEIAMIERGPSRISSRRSPTR